MALLHVFWKCIESLVQNTAKKKQKQAIIHRFKQHINQNCLMFPNEKSGSDIGLRKLWGCWWKQSTLSMFWSSFWRRNLWQKKYFLSFVQNVAFFNETHTSVDKKKECIKERLCSFFWHIACWDIHASKYSGGNENFVKMIKIAGGGWIVFLLWKNKWYLKSYYLFAISFKVIQLTIFTWCTIKQVKNTLELHCKRDTSISRI